MGFAMSWHAKASAIDLDRVIAAAEESMFGSSSDYPGFCLDCGADAFGVEPDAEQCPCESCNARAVFGAEQVLLLHAGSI